MYDIKPLEEEWKKYNSKKRKPIYISFFLLIAVLGTLYTFVNLKDFEIPSFSISKDNEPIDKVSTVKESSIILDDALHTLQVNKTGIIENIKPPVHVASKTVESIPTLPVVENIPVLEVAERNKPRKKIRNKYVKPKVTKEKPRKKMHLNIIESSSISAYKDVEKRFYESHDTDDSLFLAKSYYRKGKYKKAEYWALQTNKVNSNIEESWIIFAKSKVKLGRKNEAVNLLGKYLKRSNSKRIRNLYNKLKKN